VKLLKTMGGKGKKQGKVNKFIRSQANYWKAADDKDSNNLQYKSGKPINETIHTWLRNQIGHTQLGSKMHIIEVQIENRFLSLV
jgi:hypothetical protein